MFQARVWALSATRGRLGRRGAFLILSGFFCIALAFVSVPQAAEGGPAAVASVIFAYVLVFVFLTGMATYMSVRRRGIIHQRKVLLAMVLLGICFSFLVVAAHFIVPGSFVIDFGPGVTMEGSGYLLAFALLSIVFFLMALVVLIAACGMLWLFSEAMARILPGFLERVRGARLDGTDPLLTRLSTWLVDVPWVLDPGSLELDLRSKERSLRRWYESVLWQMALGLLLAVYISLNPVLLQSMDYTQTFGLLSLSSLLIPLMVLPWSALEAIGARIKGIRYDFMLHEGAKARMLQTMVALGTIFLIVRLAVEDVGAETIALRFAGYAVGLFFLSAFVSFVYFNYFERDLVSRLAETLKQRCQTRKS